MNKLDVIGIVGAGAWGTALSISIANTNNKTILWAKEKETVEEIENSRINTAYLPGIKIPNSLVATYKIEELRNCKAILIVCPGQFTRNICKIIKNFISKDIPLISCSKGIEQDSLMLQSEIIKEELPSNPIAILSGPSFASEVGKLLPASLNLACEDQELGIEIKQIFEKSNLSISLINDLKGAQIGGIVKNVIAIGCGIASGLSLGSNIHAALITQGIKEAAIFAEAMGGNRETLLDFCGTGDMVLTCSSKESRNFSFGYEIGLGNDPQKILQNSKKALEGFASSEPLCQIAKELKITLPLCDQIYKILYEGEESNSITAPLINL